MLTFETSLYLIFGLGLAAAALAIWLLITRTRLAGALTLVGAIALLGISTLLWQNGQTVSPNNADLAATKAALDDQTDKVSRLEQRLKNADVELSALRQARSTAPTTDTSALERQLSSVRGSLVDSEKKLSAALERASLHNRQIEKDAKQIADLEDQLRVKTRKIESVSAERERIIRETAHRLDLILERARTTRVDIGTPIQASEMPTAQTEWANEKRLKLIEQEIARLSRQQRIETSALPDRNDEELTDLRDRLAYGVSTDDYEVEVYPDREMIGGQRGRYYVVDLKDAESGVKFGFNAGKYTLDRSDRKFRKALSSFMRDVVDKIDGNATYRIMVRGSADSAAYRGRQDQTYHYREIAYLPKISNGRYVDDQKYLSVDRRITNSDLPFLRARYLKDLVQDVYPTKEPEILEGNVTSKVDRNDRNAELMLFVDW